MKIGLTGTVSVGKTTLVNELSKLPRFEHYKSATERSKYLNDLGIPLNTDSSIYGQFIFMAERSSELIHDNLITDRTIYDVCAYTKSAPSIIRNEKEILIDAGMLLKDKYDIIFYVSPEGVEIEDNGLRSIDPEYRLEIDNNIQWLLKSYPPKKLVKIKGSTEDRIKVILNEIDGIDIYDK